MATKEDIFEYCAKNIEFNASYDTPDLRPIKPVLDKFKEYLPDIEFVKAFDWYNISITIYTNYNFKFDVFAKPNMANTTFVPQKYIDEDMYIVTVYPFEDISTFFKNPDYYNNDNKRIEVPLYINSNGYLLIHREETYDIPFDLAQCNFEKGVWPCAFIGSIAPCETSHRDKKIHAFIDYITNKR